jgi:methionine aminotransferase
MYGYSVNPDTEITVTAGATQALFTAIMAFVRVGEEVIVIEPAYDSYVPGIELAGGIPVPYNLSAPDYQIDWEKMKSLVTPKTRMIIINTPHNPVGKTLKREDILALQALTEGTDILVLSDEVYEHLIYDGAEHQSVLRFPDLMKRSMAVYSFGKTFHNTGWKIGYIVGPDYLMGEFRKVHQFNVFCVNSFIQFALADYLEDPSTYLGLPNFYQQKRDFFQQAMAGSNLKPFPSEGTYFQLFDYSAISREPDTEFARRMTTEFGVAAIPVSVFYSNRQDDGVIRLCFAKTQEVLEEAGKLLRRI